MRRNRGGFAGRRRTQKLDWECAQLDVFVGVNGRAAAYALKPTDVRDFYTSPTLMAVRAYCNVLSYAAPLGGGGFAGIGVIRWMDLDNTAPVGADVPGPLSNCDLDWIARWVGVFPEGVNAGTLGNMNIFDNTHLSKARRKLENTAGLLVCFETDGVPAAFGIDLRMLLKQV